jgi:hypothetical protein
MKKLFIPFVIGLISLISCRKDTFEENILFQECEINKKTESKEIAKKQILGEWIWVQTSTPSRALQTTIIETPKTTNKNYTYKFTESTLEIFENQELMNRVNYEVLYWGEGTNLQENLLTINFLYINSGNRRGRSILFLSESGTCMTLVNSYNDAGGDRNFVKKR